MNKALFGLGLGMIILQVLIVLGYAFVASINWSWLQQINIAQVILGGLILLFNITAFVCLIWGAVAKEE